MNIPAIRAFFGTAAPQASDQGFEQTLIMIAVAFLFFYVLIMRPENKRRKELDAKRRGVKKGDRIIVAGGIVADVVRVQAESVIVKLYDGAKMEVLKVSVQDVQQGRSSDASSDHEDTETAS